MVLLEQYTDYYGSFSAMEILLTLGNSTLLLILCMITMAMGPIQMKTLMSLKKHRVSDHLYYYSFIYAWAEEQTFGSSQVSN